MWVCIHEINCCYLTYKCLNCYLWKADFFLFICLLHLTYSFSIFSCIYSEPCLACQFFDDVYNFYFFFRFFFFFCFFPIVVVFFSYYNFKLLSFPFTSKGSFLELLQFFFFRFLSLFHFVCRCVWLFSFQLIWEWKSDVFVLKVVYFLCLNMVDGWVDMPFFFCVFFKLKTYSEYMLHVIQIQFTFQVEHVNAFNYLAFANICWWLVHYHIHTYGLAVAIVNFISETYQKLLTLKIIITHMKKCSAFNV